MNGPAPNRAGSEPCTDRPTGESREGKRFAAGHPTLFAGHHAAPPRPSQRVAFVGREHELGILGGTIQRVIAGEPATLLLAGEAGVGKTRLLQSAFEGENHPAHWVACTSYASAPPFWPIVQLLRSLRLRVGAEAYRYAAGPEAESLFDPLAPQGRVAAVLGAFTDRVHLHDRVIQLLRRLAQVEPLLLVIEDAQWADPSTLEIFAMIARLTTDAPIGVFISFRTADPDHPVGQHLNELVESQTTVRLRRFTRRVTADFARAMSDTPLEDRILDQAYDTTAGNALFLREYLAALNAREPIASPEGVADLIGRRVARLDERDQHVLTCAAVVGDVVNLPMLSIIADRPRSEIDAVVMRLIHADILIAQSEENTTFTHGMIRKAVYDAADAGDRRSLHRAIAVALDSRPSSYADDYTAEAAQHWLLSDVADADMIALDRIETAARRADDAFAREEAARRYQEAVVLAEAAAPSPELHRRKIGLLLDLGRAYCGSSRPDEARSVIRRAATLAQAAGEAELLAEAALAFPPGLEGVAIAPEANLEQVELRRIALDTLPDEAIELRAELLGALATSQYWSAHLRGEAHQFTQSLHEQDQLTAQALTLSGGTSDPGTRARCLLSRLYAVWSPEHRAERPEHVRELEELATQLGDLELLAAAIGWRVLESMDAGRTGEAVVRQRAYLEVAERLAHPLHLRNARHRAACLRVLQGDLAGGVATAVALMDDATRLIGEDNAVSELATLLSMERFFVGDYTPLIEPARHVIASNPRTTLNWQSGLAFMLADSGEHDEAAPLLERLVGTNELFLPRDMNWLVSTQLLALSASRIGDVDRCTVLYDALLPHESLDVIHGWGYASYGPVGWALGELALALGRLPQAVDHLERVARTREPGPYRAVAEIELHRARIKLGEFPSDTSFQLDRLASQLRSWNCDRHGEEAHRLGRSVGRPLRTPSTLAFDGTQWLLESKRFGTATLPADRGVAYIAELLRNPGTEIDAVSLVAGFGVGTSHAEAIDLHQPGGMGELIDATARRSYLARIDVLHKTRERRIRQGDFDRAEACQREIAALEHELQRATGLGGRQRYAAEEVERSRMSTTKAIRRAMNRIEEQAPSFGAHLRYTISTGRRCSYGPIADTEGWIVESG